MEHQSAADSQLLLRRAREGNQEAQAVLIDRYRERLRQLIERRLDRRVAVRVDASDIVQETLANAYERLPDYFANPQQSFFAWLRRIAWDRLFDAYRAHINAQRRSVLKEDRWSSSADAEAVDQLVQNSIAGSLNPDHRSLLEELQARLNTALKSLSRHDREILSRRYVKHMSVGEIADDLGISKSAVTSRHTRALQRMRRLMNYESLDS